MFNLSKMFMKSIDQMNQFLFSLLFCWWYKHTHIVNMFLCLMMKIDLSKNIIFSIIIIIIETLVNRCFLWIHCASHVWSMFDIFFPFCLYWLHRLWANNIFFSLQNKNWSIRTLLFMLWKYKHSVCVCLTFIGVCVDQEIFSKKARTFINSFESDDFIFTHVFIDKKMTIFWNDFALKTFLFHLIIISYQIIHFDQINVYS